MPASTPDLEDVLDAIKAEMQTISGVGTVLTSDHTLEDDMDFLEDEGLLDSDDMDLWIVDLRASQELEQGAPGEVYDVHDVRIRYWSIRTADPDWSRKARQKAEEVRALLSGNASVFRVDGQVQLFTPETVSIESHGRAAISGAEGGQMVWQTVLSLQIEARRWS